MHLVQTGRLLTAKTERERLETNGTAYVRSPLSWSAAGKADS